MPPPVAVVDCEEVAGEDPLQPRVTLRLLRRQDRFGPAPPAAVLRMGRLGGLLVAVELPREVGPPLGRVDVVLGHVDQPHVGVLRLLLALGDVDEQGGGAEGAEGEGAGDERDEEPALLLGGLGC